MFVCGGKFEFGRRGVFNSALCQLSESHSCEVDPQVSSFSALLAAAISTQSLTQPLQRLKEWATTLTNAKTYPTKDTQASKIPFFSCLIVFSARQSAAEDWQDEMCLSTSVQSYVLLRTEKKKNISLADTKSIRQHRGLNGLDLSVIKHNQISVGELLNPRAHSQQYRDTSPKQHKSWKPSRRWQRDSGERQAEPDRLTRYRDTHTHTHTGTSMHPQA